jgi:two-component sensor histidine kinase
VLYEHKDFAKVELNVYLERLGGLLAQIHGAARRGITVRVEAVKLKLDLTRAIPLGLIVNELLSNAFKHAFQAGAGGEVVVELRELAESRASLVVRDSGSGLPEAATLEQSTSLGLQIVGLLAEQIGATLAQSSGPGARFELCFTPLPEAADPVPNSVSSKREEAS